MEFSDYQGIWLNFLQLDVTFETKENVHNHRKNLQ